MEERKGSEGQSHKEEVRKEGSGMGRGQGPLSYMEEGLYLNIFVRALDLFTPLLMGPVCLLSRFEEPICTCIQMFIVD